MIISRKENIITLQTSYKPVYMKKTSDTFLSFNKGVTFRIEGIKQI